MDSSSSCFFDFLASIILHGLQSKLEDKSDKLHAKEQELEQLTKDAANARSVIQPFHNYKVDFTAHKSQRNRLCSVQTNGLNSRIGISLNNLPRLFAK